MDFVFFLPSIKFISWNGQYFGNMDQFLKWLSHYDIIIIINLAVNYFKWRLMLFAVHYSIIHHTITIIV